ncbi:glucose-6-phosphate 1-epimerase [Aureococcus anophagefferens]|nr:glucose-6-phosphate 1-epimerase [Aureococcus anophagefferens]
MADLLKAASGANPVSRIAEGTGKGGLPVLILTHGSGAVCEVYPHGATVTKYTSPTGAEVLWTSESAVFDGAKAIRGGIPVVFPQFGPAADARVGGPRTMAQHGFTRTAAWTVDAAGTKILDSGDPQAVLTLADSAATRALRPHAFACSYTVVLQAGALHCELKITNRDGPEAPPFSPQCLLHTYLAVDDVQRAMVHGLDGAKYVDKLAAEPEPRDESNPAIRFRGETDRVYLGSSRESQPLTLRPSGSRLDCHAVLLDAADTITAEFDADVVVWNPHVDKAARMGDFDDDGWTKMCCLEPGVVAADRPSVDTNGSLVLSQTISPEL